MTLSQQVALSYKINSTTSFFMAFVCVAEHIVTNQKWCEMQPCLKHETCRQLEGDVGWLCTSSQKTKTTFVGNSSLADVRLTTKSSEMATYEHSTNVQDIFKN